VSLTVPTSGFVVITFYCIIHFDHSEGQENVAHGSISTLPSLLDFNNAWTFRYGGQLPSANSVTQPIFCTRVASVGSGSHTFYHVATLGTTEGMDVARRHFTAMFFPTNYGTVDSIGPLLTRSSRLSVSQEGDVSSTVQEITVEDRDAAIKAELAEVRRRLNELEASRPTQGGDQVTDHR
jgi:hypothetical protein